MYAILLSCLVYKFHLHTPVATTSKSRSPIGGLLSGRLGLFYAQALYHYTIALFYFAYYSFEYNPFLSFTGCISCLNQFGWLSICTLFVCLYPEDGVMCL